MLTTTRKGFPLAQVTDTAGGTSVATGRGTTTTGVVRDSTDTIGTIADFFTDFDKNEAITGSWEFVAGLLMDKGEVVLLINNSGGARVAGDVVMLDPTTDSAFILPNVASADASKIFIVAEAIASTAVGRCTILGVTRVKAIGGTVRGMYLQTQLTSAIANSTANITPGSFGFSLSGLDGANTVLAAIHAGGAGGGLEVSEVDTAPDVIGARKMIFPNGSVTDMGSQVVQVSFGSSILKREQYTVTGTTQALSLTPDTVLSVTKNGLAQTSGTDYTLAANVLTFSTALAADLIAVIYIQTNSFNPSSAPTVQEFDIGVGGMTLAGTTVTLSGIPAVIMSVVRNGVPQSQSKGDWSWTAGTTTVTFSDPFVALDHLIIGYAQNFGGGNASTVNSLPAVPSTAPAANSLVATDGTGALPIGIMPIAVVTMTGAQTLTNKILTTPHMTGPIIDSGGLNFAAAVCKIVPGATSISIRDNADANDNLIITNAGIATIRAGLTIAAGVLTFGAASSQVVPGATSLSFRNTANSADNLIITDAGAVTIRGGSTIVAGGETITVGDLTITAGKINITTAASQIIPGATSLSFRNNANSANNLIITDAGAATIRNGLTVTAGNVGIGAAPAASVGLLVQNNITSGSTTQFGAQITAKFGTSASAQADAIFARADVDGAFTITAAVGLQVASPGKTNGAGITTNYGVLVDAMTSGATNNYGIYIGAPSGGSGYNVAIMCAGALVIGPTIAAPTVTAQMIGLGTGVVTSVGAAGGATALPATPLGYWIINVGGTNVKIPYYNS
jgi:hypothetical protein